MARIVEQAEEIRILERSESTGVKDRALLENPPLFVRGEGARLWDSAGQEYIDFLSGSAVANAGYGNREIAAAIREQVSSGVNHVGALLLTPAKAQLIERLMRVVPSGLTRAHLAITGGEAVEVALKIARKLTGRQNVIAFWGAYHGRPLGAMAATSSRALRDPFSPVAIGATHFAYPYPLRNPFGLDPSDQEGILNACLGYLEAAISSPVSGLAPVAAVIVEPIQGVGGIVVPPLGFITRLRDICDRHGLLLILDEIFCGFGRTGRWFGCEHDGVLPDLMVVSKGLSSALPIAAVVGREEVMGVLPKGFQSTTFEGNPIACRAAIANMDFLARIDAPSCATAIGEQIGAWATSLSSPIVAEARGKGALWGLEIVEPGTNTPARQVAENIQREAMHRGLILYRSGHFNNVIGIVPPLVSTPEDIGQGLSVLGEILNDAAAAN